MAGMTDLARPASLPAFQDIVDDFEFIDDWDEKYRYIIDLGRQLPELPESLRTEETRVRGCASQVWLIIETLDGKLSLHGDSDAAIVKGLVAMVIALYAGLSPHDAAQLDPQAQLAPLDLAEHITPQRTNGLASMLKRIKETAHALSDH